MNLILMISLIGIFAFVLNAISALAMVEIFDTESLFLKIVFLIPPISVVILFGLVIFMFFVIVWHNTIKYFIDSYFRR